ncbi:MAG: right-handed parallel beta-helix repeat-containing protein, partial [Planctomycetota bacterium]
LGVRSLHQQGITGAGVNVAIIDQPLILIHPEYAGKIVAYHDVGCEGAVSSMHGPAVASLLVGTNCGTAPDAQVYYLAVPSWKKDAAYYADALDWIIAQNETLPPSEKIRLVSVSAQPSGLGSTFDYNQPMWDQAVARAEAAGILVLDGTWQNGFVSVCWYDADDPENVTACTPGFRADPIQVDAGHIHAPTAPRTTAEVYSEGDFSHIYWGGRHRSPLPYSKAGYSWAIPYCAGVLAMGWQIRPELTGDQIVSLLFQTAYVDSHGAQIINPQDFISFLAANEPAIQVSTQQFDFYAVTGSPDPQILSISNAGSGTLNWVIDYECNWLDVEPNSGMSVGATDITDVTLTITDLTPGVHTCELTISDPCAISDPLSVVVTLYVADGNKPTIQSLIDAAENGDTVVVPPGAYFGDGNRDLDFKGKAITLRSIDPNDPNIVAATAIVCQGTETEEHRGFHFQMNEDANSVLNGFTITKGQALRGGAIYCNNSSPTIINCVFLNNSAPWGGAIRNWNSSPKVSNCTFSENAATFGAGISNYNGTPSVTNCTFIQNRAEIWGGGMTNRDCDGMTVADCTFIGNSAKYAAGMRNYDTNSTVTNCTFTNNSATEHGGGMDNIDGSNPTVTNCTFTNNSATERGGGMDNFNGSNPTVTNCIFSGNSALNYGGGMNNFNGSNPTVASCTFTGNSAANGGGMYNSLSSSSTLTNCIFWANTDNGGTDESAQIHASGGTPLINYTCIQGWTGSLGGIDNIGTDPCFVEPGYFDTNGVWIEGDYHLLPGSPCIDAGDNNSVPADTTDLDGDGDTNEPMPFDLDGNARIVDGDNDNNAMVDIGAYEAPIKVAMRFTPQAVNPGSQGNWFKLHFVLPEGFSIEDVDTDSPAKIIEPVEPDIESDHINVFVNDDGLVEIEAAFPRAGFCGVGIDGNSVEVTVLGTLTSGQQFYGTDTIKIIDHNFECLAVFASYWLQTDCGPPDWCGGGDLNEDSAVNFLDFALFDVCCVEIITE